MSYPLSEALSNYGFVMPIGSCIQCPLLFLIDVEMSHFDIKFKTCLVRNKHCKHCIKGFSLALPTDRTIIFCSHFWQCTVLSLVTHTLLAVHVDRFCTDREHILVMQPLKLRVQKNHIIENRLLCY